MNEVPDLDHFDKLQKKLVKMWQVIGSTLEESEPVERTIVVIPSLSVHVDVPTSALQAYEERMLFMLFLLRKPSIHMIYVTSQNIQRSIIDYYLEMLPGLVSSNARKRLRLVSTEDGSSTPLSQKLLDRPHLIEHIRSLIPDIDQAHMVPFNTTDIERELAIKLDIPMYAADPRFFAFGTKSGCRQIFAEVDIQHPLGFEDLYSIQEVAMAIAKMRSERPSLEKVVVKLNEGVSGIGNAMVNLADLPVPGADNELAAVEYRLQNMQLESSAMSFKLYVDQLEHSGGIVEEFISGLEIRSPSAQLRVTPLGEVEMLSTHDQMLGGPSGQSYLGAIFPADQAYSWKIMRDAVKVGERFAKEGIVGRFAIDFVVVRKEDGDWDSYAIEVNLRKGGTTAPFLILQYLTDGMYEAESGVFNTSRGDQKFYVGSDHLEDPAYRVFTTERLFDIVSVNHLHYNHADHTGVVMHLITGVAELGRVGVTAIGNSPQEANELYRRFGDLLDREAAALSAVQ
jgi:hypothetical protein